MYVLDHYKIILFVGYIFSLEDGHCCQYFHSNLWYIDIISAASKSDELCLQALCQVDTFNKEIKMLLEEKIKEIKREMKELKKEIVKCSKSTSLPSQPSPPGVFPPSKPSSSGVFPPSEPLPNVFLLYEPQLDVFPPSEPPPGHHHHHSHLHHHHPHHYHSHNYFQTEEDNSEPDFDAMYA